MWLYPNAALLDAVRSLAFSQDGRVRRAVDYKNLGSEELGSIYESLLELHPLVNTDAATFELTAVSGSERKTTGSYYTPSSLIQVLIDSALEPVIGEALKRAAADDRPQTVDRSPSSVVQRQEQAILNLKVVDPACGSGHFLVAAAHRLARRLATVRTGEGEPAPEATRSALRSVISNCIYGVDINPMSVELCKVSLWMEALEPGKPLSFLDAHIQCGDSLVGVSPNLDISEIPDEAFNPAFGDDKATSSALKKRNKRERGGSHADKAGQLGFRFEVTHMTSMEDLARWLAERAEQVDAMPEDDSTQVQAKAKAFDDYHATSEYLKNRFELDLWTAAFFWTLPKTEAVSKADGESMLAPTQQELIQLRNGGELDSRLVERVKELSERLNFFHWELAFPKVFSGENPGFDCVLGNPPWERIKLQEEEFFASRDPEIIAAPTKAARKKLIEELIHTNIMLANEFEDAKHAADASSKFVRQSLRYKLSAVGDVNTYALFAEHVREIVSPKGFAGIIIPTGIATDDTLKDFFADLMVKKGDLIELTGYENEDFLFTGIANVVRFCTFVVSGKDIQRTAPRFAFYIRKMEQLAESERFFELPKEDLELFNPNTLTSPIFRTRVDYGLTRKIYQLFPVIENEHSGDNPWGITFMRMFDMSNDSGLFKDKFTPDCLPLYEAKMFWHFDHRFASYELKGLIAGKGGRGLPDMPLENHQNPFYTIQPQFWVKNVEIENRIPETWSRKWFIAFRDITSAKLERTVVVSVIPRVAVGNKAPVLFFEKSIAPELIACLLANSCSLVFDYIARQKIGGTSLNYFIFKQFPVMPPSAYTPADIDFIAPRVLELVYTANDLRPFAEDMGYHGEPFRWDEVRRAQLRAELDAYYARLYGLTRDELRYILDPKEVHGEDFPGETFRVLKEKEVRLYGEYLTRRLVLEAWDGQGKG